MEANMKFNKCSKGYECSRHRDYSGDIKFQELLKQQKKAIDLMGQTYDSLKEFEDMLHEYNLDTYPLEGKRGSSWRKKVVDWRKNMLDWLLDNDQNNRSLFIGHVTNLITMFDKIKLSRGYDEEFLWDC